MTAPAHRKPLRYRLINRLGSGLRRLGLPLARLDPSDLMKAVVSQTGLTDFGDGQFREGLDVLLRSAEQDGRLHFVGRMALQGLVVTALQNRLLIEQAKKQDPLLTTGPLRPPIIVMGLPRSGTTFLHRLLAEDLAGRAVPAWELLRPVRPEGTDRRRARAARQMRLIHAFAPWADRIHETHPDAPEECMVLMASTFESVIYWAVAPVFEYLRWLMTRDGRRAYGEYRILLRLLATTAPGRRLVLKSPSHTATLAALCQAIPDAMIVQCHRDPVRAAVSMNSLFRAAHGILSDDVDLHRMAAANVDLLAHTLERNLADRAACADRVVDVDYRELTERPVDVVRGIYERFDLDWSARLEERLRSHVASHPQGKHGAHRYRAADFGLSEADLAARFATYRERFGFA